MPENKKEKTKKEASNIFENIIKASVKDNPKPKKKRERKKKKSNL